ncbi:SPRY domain-containing protein, partial [Diplocarpon rosae]
MCFGSKLKSEEQSLRLNEKINHNVHINSRPVKSKLAGLSNTMSYQAPVGPPPEYYPNQNQSSEIYSAPQGPPPRHQDQHQAQVQEYAQPPPGPPPSHFLPPPGPPPGHSQPYDAPPTEPYHDWQTAVPDTSLLPPPPSMGNQRSSTNNATEEQAELGEIWCTHNPMTSPTTFPKGALEAIEKGEIGDFTQPFKAGETLGLGMTFRARDMQAPPSYDYAPAQTLSKNSIDVEIFFTRNGRKENSWNLHEEGDAQEDLPVTGLEGFNDLYAMVGTFENVEFEIIFKGGEWMYQP